MEASDARRLKALEDENTKLKKLLAEAMLDNAMLRDVAAPARSRNANESAAQCGSSSDSPWREMDSNPRSPVAETILEETAAARLRFGSSPASRAHKGAAPDSSGLRSSRSL